MTELAYVSATEISATHKEQRGISVEIVNQLLARIEAINPQINAFCTVAAEQARAEAQKAEEKVMGGEEMGPLHGVPIAIKT